jgi:hypothetical protein
LITNPEAYGAGFGWSITSNSYDLFISTQNTGKVYVIPLSVLPDASTPRQILTNNEGTNTTFGYRVSANDEYLVVTELDPTGYDPASGRLDIYVRGSGGNYTVFQLLPATTPVENGTFGATQQISGRNEIIVFNSDGTIYLAPEIYSLEYLDTCGVCGGDNSTCAPSSSIQATGIIFIIIICAVFVIFIIVVIVVGSTASVSSVGSAGAAVGGVGPDTFATSSAKHRSGYSKQYRRNV